tara:strand:- start:433 stop:792 length:360 start_codon:yes stop_codon:yes gene_type:complete
MTDISTAIQSLNTKGGNSHEYVMNGTPTNEAEYKLQVRFVESEDENGSAIFSSTQPYSWSQISAEQSALQTVYDNNKYQRDRVYPSIQDQLDMQYHDTVDGTTTWKDALAKVKSDNPKP